MTTIDPMAASYHPPPPRSARTITWAIGRGVVWLVYAFVIFAIVIVFWMVFHQNGSTLTYWANDNTDWHVSGTIAHAINPFWVVTLTFPLISSRAARSSTSAATW